VAIPILELIIQLFCSSAVLASSNVNFSRIRFQFANIRFSVGTLWAEFIICRSQMLLVVSTLAIFVWGKLE